MVSAKLPIVTVTIVAASLLANAASTADTAIENIAERAINPALLGIKPTMGVPKRPTGLGPKPRLGRLAVARDMSSDATVESLAERMVLSRLPSRLPLGHGPVVHPNRITPTSRIPLKLVRRGISRSALSAKPPFAKLRPPTTGVPTRPMGFGSRPRIGIVKMARDADTTGEFDSLVERMVLNRLPFNRLPLGHGPVVHPNRFTPTRKFPSSLKIARDVNELLETRFPHGTNRPIHNVNSARSLGHLDDDLETRFWAGPHGNMGTRLSKDGLLKSTIAFRSLAEGSFDGMESRGFELDELD